MTTEAATQIFDQPRHILASQSWEDLADKANYRASALAKLCRVSLRTVQRHFRTEYNLTVRTWLNDLRLTRALERLEDGFRPKQVAYELGFKQLSHFSRAFKERYGLSPSHYYLVETNPCARRLPMRSRVNSRGSKRHPNP